MRIVVGIFVLVFTNAAIAAEKVPDKFVICVENQSKTCLVLKKSACLGPSFYQHRTEIERDKAADVCKIIKDDEELAPCMGAAKGCGS